jgi:hypothetical protein
MDPVDWKVVTEKLSQLDIWSGESLESSSIAAVRLPPPFICCVSQLSRVAPSMRTEKRVETTPNSSDAS